MSNKKYYEHSSDRIGNYASMLYRLQEELCKIQEEIYKISDQLGEESFNVVSPFLPSVEKENAVRVGYVYFLIAGDFYKIGYSKSIKIRIGSLQTGCPHKIRLAGVIAGSKSFEKHLHTKFRKYRANGEWFHSCDDIKDFVAFNRSKQLKIELVK
jgi:hypothetical protein